MPFFKLLYEHELYINAKRSNSRHIINTRCLGRADDWVFHSDNQYTVMVANNHNSLAKDITFFSIFSLDISVWHCYKQDSVCNWVYFIALQWILLVKKLFVPLSNFICTDVYWLLKPIEYEYNRSGGMYLFFWK